MRKTFLNLFCGLVIISLLIPTLCVGISKTPFTLLAPWAHSSAKRQTNYTLGGNEQERRELLEQRIKRELLPQEARVAVRKLKEISFNIEKRAKLQREVSKLSRLEEVMTQEEWDHWVYFFTLVIESMGTFRGSVATMTQEGFNHLWNLFLIDFFLSRQWRSEQGKLHFFQVLILAQGGPDSQEVRNFQAMVQYAELVQTFTHGVSDAQLIDWFRQEGFRYYLAHFIPADQTQLQQEVAQGWELVRFFLTTRPTRLFTPPQEAQWAKDHFFYGKNSRAISYTTTYGVLLGLAERWIIHLGIMSPLVRRQVLLLGVC